jgi:hypothetical protein
VVIAVDEVRFGRRVNVETRGYDHVRLGQHIARPAAAWEQFVGHWDDLVADQHVKPPHAGRFRRYGRFAYSRNVPTLRPLPHQPFFQSREVNTYAGGIQREFEPLRRVFAESPLLRAILLAGVAAFVGEDDHRSWELGVHQIRVIGLSEQAGAPTPEGPHRDGFDYVAMHLINRRNVDGGQTLLHAGAEDISILLKEPLETIFVDDRRCLHGATEIRPRDPADVAVRDTLIVTYHAAET